MHWNELNDIAQVDQIREESATQIILIFKHSTRCGTSRAMLDRLSRNWKNEGMPVVKLYFLDLIRYREVSSRIAENFGVPHESPQVIVINRGESIYDESHWSIDFSTIQTVIKSKTSRFEEQTHEG